MTVMLPPHKVSRMLRDYFAGVPQTEIARINSADQSTVSNYAQRFKVRAEAIGLLAAGKEFGVMEELDALRSLAVELAKSRMTVEGAKEGLHIMRLFQQLGVGPDQHQDLIGLCRRVKDQGFVDASLRLNRLEETAGMTYQQVVSRFEDVVPQVESLERRRAQLKGEISELVQSKAASRSELSSLRKEVEQAKGRAEEEKLKLGSELKRSMAEFDVISREVKEIGRLKGDLRKIGLDLEAIVKLAKEFATEDRQIDGAKLNEALEKHGALSRTLAAMQSQRQSLKAELADLRNQWLDAENEIRNLSAQIAALQHKLGEHAKVLHDLDRIIERDQRQYDLFEAFMVMVLTSPSSGDKPIGGLLSSFQQVVQSAWYTAKSVEDLRSVFIRVVLGDYLHCFRCDTCGAKFIVNRGPYYQHASNYYQCPTCHSSLSVKADESFLVELVSPGKPEEVSRTQKLQTGVDRLKSLEVFMDIPCAICGKPMPNDEWVREDIVRIFKEPPKAHPACWRTPTGQAILFKESVKALGAAFGQKKES